MQHSTLQSAIVFEVSLNPLYPTLVVVLTKSTPQMVCFNCGESVIEYDIAAGNGYCTSCGTVVEENTIVNEISFGETSTGAAMVQGSYVAQGASQTNVSSSSVSLRG